MARRNMKEVVYSHGDIPQDVSIDELVPYSYCDDCKLPFRNHGEKIMCSWHWRPLSGTKNGFPKDGWNCPKDSLKNAESVTKSFITSNDTPEGK